MPSREHRILLHEQILASQRSAAEHPELARLARRLARESEAQLRWLGARRPIAADLLPIPTEPFEETPLPD